MKATVQATRRSHWRYVNSVFLEGLESKDTKPFWRYIKSQRQDAFGISPLKLNGTLHSDPREKANILNNQFKSVSTPQEPPGSNVPKLEGLRFPSKDSLSIRVEGVQKILSNLNVTNASGPDNISCKILDELSTELTPVLCNIFQQSIHTGQTPYDWTTTLVTPIFKKGNHHLVGIYRPVSLTSVLCKILEHIICNHIRSLLDKCNISTQWQHGFRSKHSCETQLLITLHDLMHWGDQKVQIDMAVLDFAKAFDNVPHMSFLGKLQRYGIDNDILNWVSAFLTCRIQSVVVVAKPPTA